MDVRVNSLLSYTPGMKRSPRLSALPIPLKKLKDEWMKDAAFRLEYEKLAPEFALVGAVIKEQAEEGRSFTQ
jgi:hypothetical protein